MISYNIKMLTPVNTYSMWRKHKPACVQLLYLPTNINLPHTCMRTIDQLHSSYISTWHISLHLSSCYTLSPLPSSSPHLSQSAPRWHPCDRVCHSMSFNVVKIPKDLQTTSPVSTKFQRHPLVSAAHRWVFLNGFDVFASISKLTRIIYLRFFLTITCIWRDIWIIMHVCVSITCSNLFTSFSIDFHTYLRFKWFLPLGLWRQRCQAFHLIRQIFQLFSISLCFPCIEGHLKLKGELPPNNLDIAIVWHFPGESLSIAKLKMKQWNSCKCKTTSRPPCQMSFYSSTWTLKVDWQM